MAQVMTWEVRGINGQPARTRVGFEAASQTFKKGDFLTVDSNGRLAQAISAGSRVGATTAATNNTAGRVVGQACQDATGTTGAYIVYTPVANHEFMLPVYHSTAASAVPNTNQIGTSYELIRVNVTVPYWAVDLEHTTNLKATIVDMVPGPTGHDGDTGSGIATAASTVQYGFVWVRFLADFSLNCGGAYS
jgi:hypothetical protein